MSSPSPSASFDLYLSCEDKFVEGGSANLLQITSVSATRYSQLKAESKGEDGPNGCDHHSGQHQGALLDLLKSVERERHSFRTSSEAGEGCFGS